jgi:hypothetical protein
VRLCEACPAGTYQNTQGNTFCSNCQRGSFTNTGASAGATACTKCEANRWGNKSDVSGFTECVDCPSGKFQQYEGRAYCETVKEGEFLSDEPAQVVDSTLSLPSVDTATVDLEAVKAAMIAKLAEDLGIDPKYIRLEDPAAAAFRSRQRALAAGSGLDLKIILLVDDGGAAAAKLAALTSSASFWAGINKNLAAKGVQTLDTTNAAVTTAPMSCNENFKYTSSNNASSTCVAVPLMCGMGTYAAAGSGKCIACPHGRFSDMSGAFACESCPTNSNSSAHARSLTECQCVSTYYMTENSVCRPCPANSNCDVPGRALATLVATTGFWRAAGHSTTFYQCPSIDACPGGAFTPEAPGSDRRLGNAGSAGRSARDGQCKKGNVGVRCEMCDEANGYVPRADDSCSQCDADDKKLALALLIGLPLGTVAGGFVFVKVLAHFAEWKTNAKIMRGLQDNFDRRSSKIRILIAFTQVVSRFAVTFRLAFPPIVNKFLQWLDIFEFFNIFQFAFIPNCLYTMDYYDQLAGKVLGPTFVLLVCYFGFKFGKQRWMYEIFLVLSFVCYPSFCDSLVLFFDCKEYEDGENYLVMYPDIKCTDSKWLSYRYPVAVMGVLLPFGIIALYFMELVGNRRKLCPQVSTPDEFTDDELKRIPRAIIGAGDSPAPANASNREPSKALSASLREFTKTVRTCDEEIGVTKEELAEAFNAQKNCAGADHAVEWLQIVLRDARGGAEHLRFLYASYKPEFYWFEAFEMIRKFLLTGAPLLTRLVSQGSNTESVWGTMLTAGFTVYVNSVAPYIDDTDQRLSLCAQFHLVTTMIAGIGNGAMEPSNGSEIFIAVAVIAPAAVLMAILVYGIIDPEYKTWFARKCVVVFRQLQSFATCCAPGDGGSNNGSDDGDEKEPAPLELDNIEASLEREQKDSATESKTDEADDDNSHFIDVEEQTEADPKKMKAKEKAKKEKEAAKAIKEVKKEAKANAKKAKKEAKTEDTNSLEDTESGQGVIEAMVADI